MLQELKYKITILLFLMTSLPLVLRATTPCPWIKSDSLICENILNPNKHQIKLNKYFFTEGDSIVATCTPCKECLDIFNFTPQEISFQVKPVERYFKKFLPCYNSKNTSHHVTYNSTSAVLSLIAYPNMTGQVFCYVRTCWDDPHVVTWSLDFTVFPKTIPPVQNFQCFVYDWDEKMECSWTNPTFKWPQFWKISLFYKDQNQLLECGLQDGDSKCVWDYALFEHLDLYLNITNTKTGQTYSTIKYVDSFHIVKPPPVEKLLVHPVSPECLNVTWEVSREYERTFRIQCKHCRGSMEYQTIVEGITTPYYNVCGLLPYNFYQFIVTSYPSDPFSGYYSDPVFAEGRTLPRDQ